MTLEDIIAARTAYTQSNAICGIIVVGVIALSGVACSVLAIKSEERYLDSASGMLSVAAFIFSMLFGTAFGYTYITAEMHARANVDYSMVELLNKQAK